MQRRRKDHFFVFTLSVPARALIYAALWLGIIIFGSTDNEAFIYFQF